ncbi:caspase-7-like [Pollicipes pollicipes]|uniref:caspase-7-like n=1 Tax=Pollicipes pollicipes TaxID=41117 RepID=UPI001884BEFD|nr:caspase-7-like [Pollicipes pollicipes]XP_037079804.1 caspase-7-like [Pollicipes pollicipes]XP_037079805.1 caspase-7-like [Pollicipes pollicipes]XP_037079806.1 caspase-7-like [Pollicipes pollicipes]XP_037079808.1 caspase-7-like [Pollicipes pollicipes]
MQKRIIDLTDLTVLADGLLSIGRDDLRAVLVGEPSALMATGIVNPDVDHRKVVDMTGIPGASQDVPTWKIYPNSRGFCMVFNQMDFMCQKESCGLKEWIDHGRREGSDLDAEMLLTTFQKLGCETKVFPNCRKCDIEARLRSVSEDNDMKSFDFLVVCFLSHGDRDSRGHFILSSDCDSLWLNDLFHYFGAHRCAALAGKLKIVITQACRGPNALRPVVIADGPGGGGCGGGEGGLRQQRNVRYTTALADFLFLSATTPGNKAFRVPDWGSYYVRALCEVLDARGHLEEISCCMKDVHNRIAGYRINVKDADDVVREVRHAAGGDRHHYGTFQV